MARRYALHLVVLVFFLCLMPDPLLAVHLELRHVDSGFSEIAVDVGDEIEVAVWLDSDGEAISGAAVFLSFDEAIFALVDEDRQPRQAGFQPFSPGSFLQNGEIFRNALLDADDPAAAVAGAQLDYSVVRALDEGSGPAATFRLRALAPARQTSVRIDESGIRETRYFTPDGSHQSFRFISPMAVQVRGIGIEGLPSRLILSRGQVDSTTIQLDELIFDPVYAPSEISWEVSTGSLLTVEQRAEGNRVVVAAPASTSLWERLSLTATNPDGQAATAFVDIFVNAGPSLPRDYQPIVVEEDGSLELPLAPIADDPDTPPDRLEWTVSSGPELVTTVIGPPAALLIRPAPDWSGTTEITLTVADDYAFADTVAIAVTVAGSNDAPRILASPNVRLTRGRSDSTLVLSELVQDAEDDLTEMLIRWSGEHHVTIEMRSGRLILTAPPVWVGEEVIEFEAIDSGGLAAAAPLTVTVVPSLAPALLEVPERLGLPAGDYAVLDLASMVDDPDDVAASLQWQVSGQRDLQVLLSAAGEARIEAPDDFAAPEVLRFAVFDPTGEKASFDLTVYAAAPDGSPAIAPLPEVSVPAGGIDASIDLDEYIFDLDHGSADMEWFLPSQDGLTIRVDPGSHVLTVAAADSAPSGLLTLQLRARDPTGREATQFLAIRVTAKGEGPPVDPDSNEAASLMPLPTLRVPAGEFDQSLRLDDYVAGVDASLLTWEVSGQHHSQVYVDPLTRVLTVIADASWTGPEILIIRGVDPWGDVVEGLLGIQILPATPSLRLRDLTEADALVGDLGVYVDPSSLLDGHADPLGLTWEVESPLEASLDPDSGLLAIAGISLDAVGTQLIDIVARDGVGNDASGHLLVHVRPADGSYGIDSDSLQVRVVPNAIQPDFLDIYVVSEFGSELSPRLRLRDSEWADLPVDTSGVGIWHGRHVLRPGMEGSVELLALAMDPHQGVVKSRFGMEVGTVLPASGKRVAMAGAAVEFGADAFGREAVVALMPAGEAGDSPELVPVASAYSVHATGELLGTFRVSLDLPEGPVAGNLALYRRSGESWAYVGGDIRGSELSARAAQLGRFAAMVDVAAPRQTASEVQPGLARFRWQDDGSGVGKIDVRLGGRALAPGAYTWDGDWLTLETGQLAADAEVVVEVYDRSGNRAVSRALVAPDLARPSSFQLGQNFPNPFNPATVIPLVMPATGGRVRVEIHNLVGQQVRVLLDGALSPGRHEITWDGQDDVGRPVSSGLYLYRAAVDGRVEVRKMSLLR
ncbi:FlgD immunoglobulin-like domain containing protein [Candidatus Latescibacterota bacterium]